MTITARPIVKVTPAQLAEVIRDMPAGQATITLVSSADKHMNKKHRETKEANPWLGKLLVESTFSAFVGGSYANQVNAQRDREGLDTEWEPLDDPRYQSVDGSRSLVENVDSGNLHMVAKPSDTAVNVNRTSYMYASNGVAVDKATIAPYFAAKQWRQFNGIEDPTNNRQGTDKRVPHVKPLIENIVALRANGKDYVVSRNSNKRVTMSDLAKRLGQTNQVASN